MSKSVFQEDKLVMPCDCGRGPVAFWLSITDLDGLILDKVGYCKECTKEAANVRALDALGLKI